MSDGEFREWKPEVKRDRNIWEFQRGYHVYAAGQHENNEQFNAFQIFLHGRRTFDAVVGAAAVFGRISRSLSNLRRASPAGGGDALE